MSANANVIKANYRLQQKVGAGPLDEKMLKKSQEVIDSNEVDFGPLGLSILKKLEENITQSQDPSISMQQVKQSLTAPVMELKANASIFHFTLIGNLANIMLNFLEGIVTMDKDAVSIVKAHHDTLHMILVRGMKGNGGAGGKALEAELQQACDRYRQKKLSQ